MTSSSLHARCGVRERWQVLGLDLLPLTLGHVDMMERFGVSAADNATDLATACIICSRPWRQVLPFFQSWTLPFRLLKWRWVLGPWDFAEKAALFHAYLRHNTELPIVTIKGDPSSSGVPFSRSLRVFLLSELNYDPATVNDTLFLDALWDMVSLQDMRGKVSVSEMSEDELEERMAAAQRQ